jgi:hypothetical protein
MAGTRSRAQRRSCAGPPRIITVSVPPIYLLHTLLIRRLTPYTRLQSVDGCRHVLRQLEQRGIVNRPKRAGPEGIRKLQGTSGHELFSLLRRIPAAISAFLPQRAERILILLSSSVSLGFLYKATASSHLHPLDPLSACHPSPASGQSLDSTSPAVHAI